MTSILSLLIFVGVFSPPQGSVISTDGTPVTVVSFKWFKSRQSLPEVEAPPAPAAAMNPANKNYERNRRAATSPGERDPNLDTVDGRSAAMEKAVQESRAPKPVDGFAYRAKVHNASAKPIETIFWEYEFKETASSTDVSRRQFLCLVSIKPNKDKELQAFSVSFPRNTVSVDALARKLGDGGEETVVINRVEFADGSIWQRKGWSFAEIKPALARAAAAPWGTEMCRGL